MRSEGVSLYKRVRISSVCEVFDGPHATPKKTECGPVYLGIDSITDDGHINPAGFNHLSSEDFIIWTKRVVPKENDVVFTYEATLGRYALIPKDFYGCLGRRIALVRAKDDSINPRWLLYYFLSPGWKSFIESRTVIGSTVNRIPIKAFPDYEIDMPPRSIQDRIASILGDIDDRIENNKKINDNLLQQAKAIFNDRYDSAEEQCPFTSLIHVLGGGTPKTGNPEFWNGDIPFFTPKDVGSPYTFQTEKTITPTGLEHCNSRLYPKNTSFVTARGTVGKVSLAGKPMAMNQSCYALASDSIDPILVYFYTLRAVDSLKHKASGAVFDAIVTRDFETEVISVIPEPESKAILALIAPMLEAIHTNAEENIRLATLRDALLPRLMSGEIDVSSVTL